MPAARTASARTSAVSSSSSVERLGRRGEVLAQVRGRAAQRGRGEVGLEVELGEGRTAEVGQRDAQLEERALLLLAAPERCGGRALLVRPRLLGVALPRQERRAGRAAS